MKDSGWVCLHRGFLGWEWYDDINTKVLFFHLILTANHKQKKWRGQVIERGQLITGLMSLSEQTGLSVRSIRTSLNKLKSTGELTIQTTNRFSLITLCNYNKYQDKENSSDKPNDKRYDKQATNKRQTNDNNQQCNNITIKQESTPLTPQGGKVLSLDDFDLPEQFKNPDAIAALQDWLDYKRLEKRKAYKPRGFKAFLAERATWTTEQLVAAVQYSSGNGYDGCHLPKQTARAESNFEKQISVSKQRFINKLDGVVDDEKRKYLNYDSPKMLIP